MAVPPEFTSLNFAAKYMQSKTLSDDTDEILRLQGVGWFVRQAIRNAYIYPTITQSTEDGVETIQVEQVLSGGVSRSSEKRYLDWKEREANDGVFGDVLTRTRRVNLEEIENAFLKEGWLAGANDGGIVHCYGQSDTPKSGRTWVAEQTWGIAEINGERRYARHVFFTGPKGEEINARLVYDYQGPL